MTHPEEFDFLLGIFQMHLGQMYIALRGAQIRMPHQLGHTEYIDAGFDCPCAIGVPQIIEAKWRLNFALPLRSEMRRLDSVIGCGFRAKPISIPG